MTASDAYTRGVRAALAKYAGTLGATIGVQPQGPEVSHGTARVPYTFRASANDGPQARGSSVAAANMSDQLWDSAKSYDKQAPGSADGSFGEAVIG